MIQKCATKDGTGNGLGRHPNLSRRCPAWLPQSGGARAWFEPADLAVRHGVPEGGDLYVSKVGVIAAAVYRRWGLADDEQWVTYTEEQAHYSKARWVDQQIRVSGGKVALRASTLAMQLDAVRAG